MSGGVGRDEGLEVAGCSLVKASVGRSFHHCGARVEKERALEAGERRRGRASLLVQEERRGRV